MEMNGITCPGCGKKVDERAPACPHCGTKIDVENPGDIKPTRHEPADLPPPKAGAEGPRDVSKDSTTEG